MHFDQAPERAGEEWGTAGRAAWVVRAFAEMLRAAVEAEGAEDGWLLFLEDDLEFHPRLGALVRSWPALADERCVLASLFNPLLQGNGSWGQIPRAFAAEPATFLGAQALLLRRSAVRRALEKWESVAGMQAQRLAKILGAEGPIWVHRPSLVQHVAGESSWGARVQTALDFNPRWQAP